MRFKYQIIQLKLVMTLVLLCAPYALESASAASAFVNLKVNGTDGPINVMAGEDLVFSWTTLTITTPNSCSNTFNKNKANSSTGEAAIKAPSSGSHTYTLTCTVSGTAHSDSVQVNITIPQNPYHTDLELSAIKNWYTDSTPISITETTGTITPYTVIDSTKRKYIDFKKHQPLPGTFLPQTYLPNGVAGGWDDVYASLDNGHSFLAVWGSTYRVSYHLAQIINIKKGLIPAKSFTQFSSSFSDNDFAKYGINFTSNSTSGQGHQKSNSPYFVPMMEFSSYFFNTVRSAPAYYSYLDTNAVKAVDSFDGLFSHSLNSLGRSNSEINGISKMLIASSSLPRETKNLLKSTGNFAPVMLYVYKISLPYVDGDGSPLPFENELFHRVAYLTTGHGISTEFFPNNKFYHQYNDASHLYNMTMLANGMTDATPPVVLLKLTSRSVKNNGLTVLAESAPEPNPNPYMQLVSKTQMRIWGKNGDEITLRIDLTQSYDLKNASLTFKVMPLYPEQKNISIVEESYGKYKITATHDPKLPKGRIPIIVTAHNGSYASNPAFINFYWPEEKQTPIPSGYLTINNLPSYMEVNRNLRPIISVDPNTMPLTTTVNKETTFNLSCNDPEGFKTHWYRWANEDGKLNGNTFSFTPNSSMAGTTQLFHFICSDGTGGYNSVELQVKVDGIAPIIWGDVNTDGNVTIEDAKLLAQHALGMVSLSVEQRTKADVSGNGRITFYDVTLIAKKAKGLINLFPIEKK